MGPIGKRGLPPPAAAAAVITTIAVRAVVIAMHYGDADPPPRPSITSYFCLLIVGRCGSLLAYESPWWWLVIPVDPGGQMGSNGKQSLLGP